MHMFVCNNGHYFIISTTREAPQKYEEGEQGGEKGLHCRHKMQKEVELPTGPCPPPLAPSTCSVMKEWDQHKEDLNDDKE